MADDDYERPDWLQNGIDNWRILGEGAEALDSMVDEQGLPAPNEWEGATIIHDDEGWRFEIYATDGYTYTYYPEGEEGEAYPGHLWDIYEFVGDFVDVEIDYEEATT